MEIFQRTLSWSLVRGSTLKADAKVRLFSEPPKLLEFFFRFSRIIFPALDIGQSKKRGTPFIIYAREEKALAAKPQATRGKEGGRGACGGTANHTGKMREQEKESATCNEQYASREPIMQDEQPRGSAWSALLCHRGHQRSGLMAKVKS